MGVSGSRTSPTAPEASAGADQRPSAVRIRRDRTATNMTSAMNRPRSWRSWLTMTGSADLTSGAVGRARLGVQRGCTQHEADEAADGQQAVAGDGQLEDEQDDAEADEQQAADIERQAAEADEGEDDGERAQDAGDEVRVLELEQQSVEAEREQDEGDVRVGQQVQEATAAGSSQSRGRPRRPSRGVTAAPCDR